MDIFQALHTLEKLEGTLAETYRGLGKRLEGDPPLAAVFTRLSAEETDHLNLVRYQLRLARQNPGQFSDIPMDSSHLDLATRSVEALKTGLVTLSPREAVATAIRCEQSTAEAYYRTALAKAYPGLAKLVAAMSSGCDSHASALLELATARNWLPKA